MQKSHGDEIQYVKMYVDQDLLQVAKFKIAFKIKTSSEDMLIANKYMKR